MLSKSIDFLLEYAGPVIKYRLKKEILKEITKTEEESLLEQIYQMPYFKLLQTYVKPDGYIGSGMHSWDNWKGQKFHETPLQDGEAAARLLAYYAVPKTHPIVSGYVQAMRDEEILQKEFSYIPPEITRFENRFVGLNSGNSLMALIYTMQAMLGYGDDCEDVKEFQQISLKGFQRILEISSLDEITTFQKGAKRKYNYPYIEENEYFPDVYTLGMLAYTQSWRTKENIKILGDALNHINAIMKPENNIHIRIKGKYLAPCWAFIHPFRPFHPDAPDSVFYRRALTEIAMLGVSDNVNVIRESVNNIEEELKKEGVLRMYSVVPKGRRYSPKKIAFPSAYNDVCLEADYKTEEAWLCDLTFWAVQFLYFVKDYKNI